LKILFNFYAQLRTSFQFISKPLALYLGKHLKQFINWSLAKGVATGITAESEGLNIQAFFALVFLSMLQIYH